MSLNLELLKNVKHRGTKIVAQCPACAETGGDSKSIHLVVYQNGKFGCTANPKDKAHRRRIAELAGDPIRQVKPWFLKLHGVVIMSGGQAQPAVPIVSLARSKIQRKSPNAPSEPSVPDTSDAYQSSTHSTSVFSVKVPVHVHIGPPSTPSEVSEIITQACAIFDGKVVAVVSPDGIVPGRFRDVLRTWSAIRQHPAWRDHPQLQGYVAPKTASVPGCDDQAAWIPVARRILAGEFDGADSSTVESLTMGLRGIRDPVCEAAIGHLRPPKKPSETADTAILL